MELERSNLASVQGIRPDAEEKPSVDTMGVSDNHLLPR